MKITSTEDNFDMSVIIAFKDTITTIQGKNSITTDRNIRRSWS